MGGQGPWLVALVGVGHRPIDRCAASGGAGRREVWTVSSRALGGPEGGQGFTGRFGGTSAGVRERQPEDPCSGSSAGLG